MKKITLLYITACLLFLNSCTKNTDGTVTVIPIAPTALKAATLSTTEINLTWNDNSTNEDGFKIERKTGSADFSLVATVGADKISFKDSLLAPNTKYFYRVYGYNSAGKSLTYTNLDSAITNPDIPDINTGLVAYYPFTGNAVDSSGNGNNGTVNGATLTADRFGNANKAFNFNGSNWIDINNAFFDNGWIDYSISLFFNYSQTVSIGGNIFLNTVPHGGFSIGFNYYNNLRVYHFKDSRGPIHNGWDIFSSDNFNQSIINSNTWYHIAIVKNGLNYKYYFNGILDKSITTNLTPIHYLHSMKIGAIDGNTEFFNGKLDEIRFYNRALDQEQVTYLATH